MPTAARVSSTVARGYRSPMTAKETRLANLRRLVAEFGSITAVAEASLTSEKYLWQILSGRPLPSGTTRGVGDTLARKLEAGCQKPPGWMDTRHASRRAKSTPTSAQAARVLAYLQALPPSHPIVGAVEIILKEAANWHRGGK